MFAELTRPAAPRAVREWTESHPAWLEIRTPKEKALVAQLDPGESQAIALAIEMGGGVLLIDERSGRREAQRRGLSVAGTLSILDDASHAGLLNFDLAIARLLKTNFRVSRSVLAALMQRRP